MDVSLWSPAYTGTVTQHPVSTCIVSHSFHIRTLELNISTQVLAHFYPIGRAPVGDDLVEEGNISVVLTMIAWPVLEKVTLDFGMEDWDSPMMRGDDVQDASFWLAPRLKSITLISVAVDLFNPPLKWRELEEIVIAASGPHDYPDQLDYQSFTPGEAKHLLKTCPKLSALSIVMSNRDYEFPLASILPPTFRRLTHYHLAELHLEDIIINLNVHYTTFFQDLQLPALKTVTYFLRRPQRFDPSAMPCPYTFNNPLLCSLAAQGYPVLISTLKIDESTISYRGLMECLKLMPKLEKLRLLGDWHLKHPSVGRSFDDHFLRLFLPTGMRTQSQEQTGTNEGDYHDNNTAWTDDHGNSDSDPPLRLPAMGLCPLLGDFIIGRANFTPDGILHFINAKLALNSGLDESYARPRRFYANLVSKEHVRSDFVARDATGGANPTEEALRGFGLDAKIILRMPHLAPVMSDEDTGTGWDEPRVYTDRGFDPKRGLPKWYGGDAEEWHRREYA